jgi:hypothetical protein
VCVFVGSARVKLINENSRFQCLHIGRNATVGFWKSNGRMRLVLRNYADFAFDFDCLLVIPGHV